MQSTIINDCLFCYNKNLPPIPKCIRKIKFSGHFNDDINSLPDYITHISLSPITYNYSITKLPSNLIWLEIKCSNSIVITYLPPKLKYLHLHGSGGKLPELPDTLLSLHVDAYYSHKLPELPIGLVELRIGFSSPQYNCINPYYNYAINSYYVSELTIFSASCKFAAYDRAKVNKHNITKRRMTLYNDLLNKKIDNKSIFDWD